jgi:hypothetical protein
MKKRLLWVALSIASCTGTGDDDDTLPDGGTMADSGERPDAGDSGDGGDAGENPIELRGACSDETRWGLFLVEAQPQYSLVDGKVANGVVPAAVPELVGTEGECKLLKRRNPFCDPPCQAGQACDHDGTCITYPMQQNVGTVSISGLEKEIVMEPLPPSNNYFDTQVPHPVFASGAEVHLTTTEGAFGALELFGFGFELLEANEAWTVARGSPLSLTWTAPAAPVRTRIDFRLNIDQHGNSPVNLVCSFDDDGAAEIPASLIDALFTAGVSGFPNGALTRETVDSMPIGAGGEGCVELRIGSPRRGMVTVSGHTPCNGPNDCPPGQTCNIAINTCE